MDFASGYVIYYEKVIEIQRNFKQRLIKTWTKGLDDHSLDNHNAHNWKTARSERVDMYFHVLKE